MKDFHPILRVGGTVMLAPEFRRVGMYLAGLKEYQPYKVLRLVGDSITLLTEEGARSFKVHCFDPVSCKFGLFEKVKIYNRKRRVYSAVMTIQHYTHREGYKLTNGNYYDVSALAWPWETVETFQTAQTESA